MKTKKYIAGLLVLLPLLLVAQVGPPPATVAETSAGEHKYKYVTPYTAAQMGAKKSTINALFTSYANREKLNNQGRAQLDKIADYIDTLGIATNFLDGCFYRAGLSSQTSVTQSMVGFCVTNVPGWSWEPGGILISNTAAGELKFHIPDQPTECTFIVWLTGTKETGASAYNAFGLANTNGTLSGQLHIISPNTSGYYTFQHYALGAVTTLGLTPTSLTSVNNMFIGVTWGLNAVSQIIVDGTAFTSGTTAAHTPLNHFYLGGSTGASRYIIGGWMVFNKKLTSAQVTGLGRQLERSRVVIDGDSISLYYNTNSAARPNLAGFVSWTNQAVGGESSFDVLAATNNWKSLGADGTNYTDAYYCVMAGANDIANSGTPATTILANLRSMWSIARANGFKPVAYTVTGGAGILASGNELIRIQLNDLIRGDGTNYYQLMDVDRYLSSSLYGTNYYQNATWFPDGVHPAVVPNQRLGDLLGDSLFPAAKIVP